MIDPQLLLLIEMFAITVLGIVVGSWLNSKLLTRTWKGDSKTIKKEATQSPEYKMLIELLTTTNQTLQSPEAKNLFQNLNNLINEVRTQLTQPPNATKPILLHLPKKPQEEKNEGTYEKDNVQ
jgi:hypothetical protein